MTGRRSPPPCRPERWHRPRCKRVFIIYYELQASATILDLAGLSKVKPVDPFKVLPGAAPRISVEPDADFPTLPPISITVPDGAVQLM